MFSSRSVRTELVAGLLLTLAAPLEGSDMATARTLFQSGYPVAAAHLLRSAGSRSDELGWVPALYQELPDDEVILALESAEVARRTSSVSLRELIHLVRAKRFVEDGQAAQAVRYIQANPVQGQHRSHYRYLFGNALAQNKSYREAIQEFEALLNDLGYSESRLRRLTLLALARTHHELAEFQRAVYYYNRLSVLDPEFPDAVFEKGWSFFMSDEINGALGATLSFAGPYYWNEYFPEAYLVRAAAFYRFCYYDRAVAELREFKKRYEPLRTQVKRLLNELKSDAQALSLLKNGRAETLEPMLLNYLIRHPKFQPAYALYKSLLAERAKGKANWDSRVQALAARAYAEGESRFAKLVRSLLEQLEVQLNSHTSKGDLIEIEILRAKERELQGETAKGQKQARKLQVDEYEIDEQIHVWGFKGEFWLDEIGSHYYGLDSACTEEGETFD